MITYSSTASAHVAECPGFVDITDDIQELLAGSNIKDGVVTLFTADESAALVVNERESGLLTDMKTAVNRVSSGARIPRLGLRSVVFPAVDGRIYLGGWQRVMLVGLSEAGVKNVVMQVTGE